MTYKYFDNQDRPQSYTMTSDTVSTNMKSLSYDTGWFNYKILKAYEVLQSGQKLANTPCGVVRYNPVLDTGENNKIWLTPINAGHWNVPAKDDLFLTGYPLWAMLFGFTSYIKQVLKDPIYFDHYMLVIKSPALYRVFWSR